MFRTSETMDTALPKSKIVQFFGGKNVLITGGTGFLGKVLLHKLLHTCPDIGTIYLLIRGKRGKTSDERLSEIIRTNQIFKSMNEDEIFRKVRVADGDLLQPGLGLTPVQRSDLVENINVIFHSAATVKFDDTTENAIQMNILGTERLADLAKEMKDLKAFVHVSTAYSHCYRTEIDEVLYPCKSDYNELLTDISPWPNSYTMSKALAENSLAKFKKEIPLAIVRPSIVISSRAEPMPGWVDNFNGPIGLITGFSSGLLRTIYLDKHNKSDIIPVDVVINLMCAVAYDRSLHQKLEEMSIFNCTSGSVNPITWGGILENGFDSVIKFPYEKSTMLWYPGITFQTNQFVDYVARFFINWVPAYLVDLCLYLRGKRPMRLVKLTSRLMNGIKVLGYFAQREWNWRNSNSEGLFKSLNETDRALFNFDISDMNWEDYLENMHLGIRRFLLKQDDSSFEESKRYLRRLNIRDQVFKFLILLIPIYLARFLFSSFY